MGTVIFADAGFRVIEAVNGEEALEFLNADDEVRLLFTDVSLPGKIDGLALGARVEEARPRGASDAGEGCEGLRQAQQDTKGRINSKRLSH